MTKKMMDKQSTQVMKSNAIERAICLKQAKGKVEDKESQDRRMSWSMK